MELVTGKKGSPHITSQQDRQKNQGAWGEDAYIMKTGNMLEPQVQSSNEIHIRDGALMFQGALFAVKVGTYDVVTINNGSQGMLRKDLIVARYTYDVAQNVESAEWVVIQGEPAESNPVLPTPTSGDIQTGSTTVDCPVFAVNLDGINVTGVDIIPEYADTIPELMEAVAELNSKTEDSGWVQMTAAGNFSQMLKCRKIGKAVYVMGTLHFSDSGAFFDDQQVATVPENMKPSASYGTYECLIPIAHHNGSGTQARIYIRPDNRRVYITGTGSATNAIAAVACYLTDD